MAKAEVQYVSTTLAALNNIPLVNGQLIALRDADLCYYDMLFNSGDGEEQVVRRPVARIRKVAELPEITEVQGLEETLFVVVGEETGIFIYNADLEEFIALSQSAVTWTDFNPHDIPDPPEPTGSDLTAIANLIIQGTTRDSNSEEVQSNE